MPDEAPPTACPASLIRHANSRWRVGLIVIAVIAAIAVVAGVISMPPRIATMCSRSSPMRRSRRRSPARRSTCPPTMASTRCGPRTARCAGPTPPALTRRRAVAQSVLGLALDGATLYVLATSTGTGEGRATLTALNAGDGTAVEREHARHGARLAGPGGSLLIVAALWTADQGRRRPLGRSMRTARGGNWRGVAP